jgi:hypothetical protein
VEEAEGDKTIGDVGPGEDLLFLSALLIVTKLSNLKELEEFEGVGSYPKEECL